MTNRGLLAALGCLGAAFMLVLGTMIGASLVRVDLPVHQIEAAIELRPAVTAGNVEVSASTDLPDGARIFYYFYHERNDVEWTGGLPPYNVQGYTDVQGAAFTFTGDPSEWPPGRVQVWAQFDVYEGEQPPHILELFGQKGERLGGKQARYADSSDYKQLYVETEISIP